MAKTNQELAQEQLDSMGIPWKGAEMKPFSPSINPFNPNFRATVGSKLRELIDDSGIGGGYRQGLINAGEGIETAIDFTPVVGDAVGIGDVRTSYNQGDMLGTGINAAAAAVGVLPLIGDVAAKGVKGASSALRNIYHGTSSDAAKAIDQFGFDLNKTADGSAWFTTNPDIGEVAAAGKGGVIQRQLDESNLKLASYDETDKYSNGELIGMGYDGAVYPNGEGGAHYEIWNQDKLDQLTPLSGLRNPSTRDITSEVANAKSAYDSNPNNEELRRAYMALRRERDAMPTAEVTSPLSGSGTDEMMPRDIYDMDEDEYIQAINPQGSRIAPEARPNLGMGDMYGMAPRNAEEVMTQELPSGEIIRYVQDGDSVYALGYNPDLGEEDVLGYMVGGGDGSELAVVDQMQGQGIGGNLSYLYRSQNPMAQSGGFTEAGEGAARKTYRRIMGYE